MVVKTTCCIRPARRNPNGEDDWSTSQNSNNSGPSTPETPPEPEELRMNVNKFIRFAYAGSNQGVVVGSGAIGKMNIREISEKDLFIRKEYVNEIAYNNEEIRDKIFQASKENSGNMITVSAIDEIVTSECLNRIRNVLYRASSNIDGDITFSWSLDEDNNLMFNVHIDDTILLDNIESIQQTIDASSVGFYIDLLGAVHPQLEDQIKQHCWIDNREEVPTRGIRRKIAPKESSKDFGSLFDTLRNARQAPPSYNLRTDSLACTLRGYQKEAVDFLIHREVESSIDVGLVHEYVKLANDVFYLPSLGAFVKDISKTNVNVVGGILADEMGLGKTVELLSLILSNQSEDDIDQLRNTRGVINNTKELPVDESQDSSIVKDLLGEMVSQVSAFCDGKEGLETIKRAKKMKPHERQNNYVHRAKLTCSADDVRCGECGEIWSAKKVHWSSELNDKNITFKCPTCITQAPTIPVSATLIVVPKSICHQWFEEIKKHVKDDVKIDMYMGVAVDGYKNPHYFNQFHIVITTYDVLAKEFEHLQEKTDNYSTRIRKRTYAVSKRVVSPLPYIKWWRICLDEWQMVTEGRQGEVCWQLQCRSRWCISGTPLVKNFNDFQKMLRFLNVTPYNQYAVWESVIYNRYTKTKNLVPMVELLAQIFWRNSKKDVANQLRIPPKEEVVTNVLLSPIEMEYYKLKLAETKSKIVDAISLRTIKDETQMGQIPPALLRSLMDLMNSVRWSLVTGEGYLKENPENSKKVLSGLTSQEVFANVIKKTRHLLAEATRDVMAVLTGLAAHKMRLGQYGEAIDCYLKVMFTITDCESKLKASDFPDWALVSPVDMKQRIHSVANLIEASSKCADRITSDEVMSYQLQLDDLERNLNDIDTSKKIIEENGQQLGVTLELHKETNQDMCVSFLRQADTFETALPSFQQVVENLPIEKIKEFIEDNMAELAEIRPNLMHQHTKLSIWTEIEATCQDRQKHLDQFVLEFQPWTKFLEVDAEPESELFHKILNCPHNNVVEEYIEKALRVEQCRKNDCPLCLLNRSILNVEDVLSISKIKRQRGKAKTARSLEQRVEVALAEDPLYLAFNSICQHSEKATKTMALDVFENFEIWMVNIRSYIDLVNIIVECIQLLVTKSRERKEAKSRAPLDAEWLKQKSLQRISTEQYNNFLSDRLEKNENTMRAAHAKMSYVQTLLQKDDDKAVECPVCYAELETAWKVMPCLHNMCSMCYCNFIKQRSMKRECVVCRAPFRTADVKSVTKTQPIENIADVATTSTASAVPVEQYNIKGIQLTFKMAAVMRNIVSVLEQDPSNKIIVFSAMSSALDMLSHIMKSLEMQHTLFSSRTCDLEHLAQFKHSYDIKVLLLPLSFGANGLNLVEANHIFFMEPIPNASVFQQATGRVFRMGQSRATTIHHLITKDTIEETIHSIVTGANETGLTFGSFKKILGINQ